MGKPTIEGAVTFWRRTILRPTHLWHVISHRSGGLRPCCICLTWFLKKMIALRNTSLGIKSVGKTSLCQLLELKNPDKLASKWESFISMKIFAFWLSWNENLNILRLDSNSTIFLRKCRNVSQFRLSSDSQNVAKSDPALMAGNKILASAPF